jgi:hypothetical protein
MWPVFVDQASHISLFRAEVQFRACRHFAAADDNVLDRAILKAKPRSDASADDHPASKTLLGKS